MKKIGLILLVVIMALGALGVGYAAWTSNITVNGFVKTGTLAAIFNGTDAGNMALPMSGPWADTTHVAAFETSGNGTATINVIIDNAYPGLVATIPIVIKNSGTIPFSSVTAGAVTSNLPIDTTYVLSGVGALAVGASTSGTTLTVSIPDIYSQLQQSNPGYTFTLT
jgi:hypothetical protein